MEGAFPCCLHPTAWNLRERWLARRAIAVAVPVRVGKFREDLFYRINILQLRMPALRDRPDDVLWLAHRFVRDIASRLGEPTKLFHPSAEA